MIEVTMQEIEKNVLQLIQQAIAGEEVVILSNNLPVVKLSAIKAVNGERKPRLPGSAKGLIRMVEQESAPPDTDTTTTKKRPPVFGSAKPYLIHMAEDFDAPLEDFAEYM